MRGLLLVFFMVFGFSANSMAESVELPGASYEQVQENKQASCYGYANCGGYQVSCTSYGAGCYWEATTRPLYDAWGNYRGQQSGVQCVGLDSWGRWVSSYAWCRN